MGPGLLHRQVGAGILITAWQRRVPPADGAGTGAGTGRGAGRRRTLPESRPGGLRTRAERLTGPHAATVGDPQHPIGVVPAWGVPDGTAEVYACCPVAAGLEGVVHYQET